MASGGLTATLLVLVHPLQTAIFFFLSSQNCHGDSGSRVGDVSQKDNADLLERYFNGLLVTFRLVWLLDLVETSFVDLSDRKLGRR